MRADRRWMCRGIAALFLLMPAWPRLVSADSCTFQFDASARSENGRFTFKAHRDGAVSPWKVSLTDTKTKKTVEGTIKLDSFHTHFEAFVTNGGSRIVVFEPIAGGLKNDRVRIYDRNFRLLKAYKLDDLLTPDELGRVGTSVSHVQFVDYDRERKAGAWLEDGVFQFRVRGGRTIRIDPTDPKVLDPPAGTKAAQDVEPE